MSMGTTCTGKGGGGSGGAGGVAGVGGVGGAGADSSISLPILTSQSSASSSSTIGNSTHPKFKPSKMGKWRFLVLVLVHVIIIAHIIQWLLQGMTVSPVEPSESMYTLEGGQLNAGFIFFILALISTFVFGRYFCGWACHVVALQDGSTWLLGKIGIRPKPFRSRLMLFGPLLLALYMFVWPTFRREALIPLAAKLKIELPDWIGPVQPFPGFSNHLMTQDFWATFPPWYIAIPFFIICGFFCVYLLGSKGFCTYGCPYGGFFAPLDKLSIGRIVVSDACEGCGHCTAACTSNVRVHQEVRDFGMVMDPGCMKCMDCVSVCPNGALSFSFAKPALFTQPRNEIVAKTAKIRPEYDLSFFQELIIFALAITLTLCFRGMAYSIPLLMAVGMGISGAYLGFKLWEIATAPNSRMQNLQLKIKGRIKPLGVALALFTLAYFSLAAWSGYVRFSRWQGDLRDAKVTVDFESVFSPGYVPDPAQKAFAEDSLAWYALGAPPSLKEPGAGPLTGIGWDYHPSTLVRLAWLEAVAGKLDKAERYLTLAVDSETPAPDWVFGLARVYMISGKPPESGKALYERVLAKNPGLHDVRNSLAMLEMQTGNGMKAIELVMPLLTMTDPEPAPMQRVRASEILIDAGRPKDAYEDLAKAVERDPNSAILRAGLATAMLFTGQGEKAVDEMKKAVQLEPQNILFLRRYAMILAELGRMEEAQEMDKKANDLLADLERQHQRGGNE